MCSQFPLHLCVTCLRIILSTETLSFSVLILFRAIPCSVGYLLISISFFAKLGCPSFKSTNLKSIFHFLLMRVLEAVLGEKDESTTKAVKFAPVRHSCKVYYELSPGRPKLSQALNLLRQSPTVNKTTTINNDQNVSQRNASSSKHCNGYTFAELCHEVQASKTELKNYLDKLNVMFVHEQTKKLRLLSDSYFTDVAMTILRRLEEESWDSSRVPRQECLECLTSLEPEDVLQFVFDKLFDPVLKSNSTLEDSQENDQIDGCLYKLNERSVCRLFTYYILSGFEKMQLSQFEQVMTESLPDGVTWNFDYVKDCVITIEAPLKTRDLAAYVK